MASHTGIIEIGWSHSSGLTYRIHDPADVPDDKRYFLLVFHWRPAEPTSAPCP